MDINERARQIKAEQEAAKQAAERERAAELLKQQEAAHHAQEVRRLIQQFVEWANQHRIPYDFSAEYLRFVSRRERRRVQGWVIAQYNDPYPPDHDPNAVIPVVVNQKGKIENTYIVQHFDMVTIKDIEEHIAKFVARHNIPWD